MVAAGEQGAAAIYRDLLPRETRLPGGATRVRLGLARALLLAGEPGSAFPYLRELAQRLDAAPRPDAFWHAWTLMLETLAEENKSGDRSGAIRAHLKRLESLDANLGGEPWHTRLTRLRDALGS
jgi:hypothetical protein